MATSLPREREKMERQPDESAARIWRGKGGRGEVCWGSGLQGFTVRYLAGSVVDRAATYGLMFRREQPRR